MATEHPKEFPPQTQKEMPGYETQMKPEPQHFAPNYLGSNKLKGKVAIITGGDSGIGRAVAVLFGREGANVAIAYLEREKEDAQKTKTLVEKEGAQCLLLPGDVRLKQFCIEAVQKTIEVFKQLDIVVNHAGVQYKQLDLENITEGQLDETLKTNVYAYFYMVQAALPYLKEGSSIINTTSVNAYKGNKQLIDYTTSKGANRAFTYSLALNLAPKGIRVNAVAPGPIWTPFIPSTFEAEAVTKFGQKTLLGRAGQPEECAPSYVFLASEVCSSYITGQTLHPNGGTIVDG